MIISSKVTAAMKTTGAEWAVSGISSPFFYVPFDLALNGGETTARCISNYTGLSTFDLIDGVGTAGNIDDTEGYFSANGQAVTVDDTDGAWPGTGFDTGTAFYNALNVFDSGTYPDGRILLTRFRGFIDSGAAGANPVICFGNGLSSGTHSWQINMIPTLGAIRMNIWADGIIRTDIINKDIASIGSVADDTLREYMVVLDTKFGNIKAYVGGVDVTASVGAAAILAGFLDHSNELPNIGLTLFAEDITDTANFRTIDSSSEGHFNEKFMIDLTSQTTVPDYDAIALALSKSPAGSIPHMLSKY